MGASHERHPRCCIERRSGCTTVEEARHLGDAALAIEAYHVGAARYWRATRERPLLQPGAERQGTEFVEELRETLAGQRSC